MTGDIIERPRRAARKSNYRIVPNGREWCVDESGRDSLSSSGSIRNYRGQFISKPDRREDPVSVTKGSIRSHIDLLGHRLGTIRDGGVNATHKTKMVIASPSEIDTVFLGKIVVDHPGYNYRRSCEMAEGVSVRKLATSMPVTTFEPNKKLSRYLVIAMNELRLTEERKLEQYSEQLEESSPRFVEEIRRNLSDLDRSYDENNAKDHLRTSVKRLFGTIGRGLQNSRIDSYHLTSNGGEFEKYVRDAILERVLIRPYDARAFLNELYNQLKLVARSEAYGGSWGHLSLCGDELCLAIKPKNEAQHEDWVKARSL